MNTDIQSSTNCSPSIWNSFLQTDTNSIFSDSSEDDDVFVDTCCEIKNVSSKLKIIENSECKEDSNNLMIKPQIDPKVEESLVQRFECLKKTIRSLSVMLTEECHLWKKEREAYDQIHEQLYLNSLDEATEAARIASEAYAVESTKGHFPSIISHNGTLSYPKQNNPFTVTGNILSSDYYQKLNQIDRLCDEELQKIRCNADLLKPLKQIVSQWDIVDENSQENCKTTDTI